MSIKATNRAFEIIASNLLSVPQRLCLLALAHRHSNTTGQCDPSAATLAKMTGLSRRAVFRAIGELEDADIIIRVSRSTKHGRISTQYDGLGGDTRAQGPRARNGTLGGGDTRAPNKEGTNNKGPAHAEKEDAENGRNLDEPLHAKPQLQVVGGRAA